MPKWAPGWARGWWSVIDGIVAPLLTLVSVDADSVDFEVDDTGTAYWLVDDTTNQDEDTIKLGGGLASGSFAVTAGENSEAIDLSAVSAGSHRFHMFVEDADGNPSNVIEDDLVIAASGAQVTLTEFNELTDGASRSAYSFVIDLLAVPDGARCIVAFSARDVTTGATTITSVSAATHTITSRVIHENNNGSNSVPVGIAEFTKQAGVTSDTITWQLSGTANVARQWGAALANAHATTVDATGIGAADNTDTVAASAPLATTNLGIVIAAIGSFDATAQTYTESPAGGTEHRDDGTGHNLVIAAWPADGTALTPSATSSLATTDVLTLAAISIPPA